MSDIQVLSYKHYTYNSSPGGPFTAFYLDFDLRVHGVKPGEDDGLLYLRRGDCPAAGDQATEKVAERAWGGVWTVQRSLRPDGVDIIFRSGVRNVSGDQDGEWLDQAIFHKGGLWAVVKKSDGRTDLACIRLDTNRHDEKAVCARMVSRHLCTRVAPVVVLEAPPSRDT